MPSQGVTQQSGSARYSIWQINGCIDVTRLDAIVRTADEAALRSIR